MPPDRAAWDAAGRKAGWQPLEALHMELLHYELLRAQVGDEAMEGPAGPVVEWPFGAWSLAEHRATIAHHRREMERIALEESRGG